ncbi:MAG: 2-oxoacid:acceptor oxidoreductase family protein [Deltaproteobacteria bacterium]|nr:2-oxoacid:acceptor oxidoreductase family protein [Deltaproteobacteria bacterium]
MRTRIIFSGSGGQGVVTASIILAEAAVLHEGLNAVQAQSYGPEARGGATRSDVIISDTDIHFPKVNHPNMLVCLTQEAYNTFSGLIRPGGLLLIDRHYVKPEKKVDARQVELDIYKTIMKEIGKPIVFNICMLGAFITLTPLVKPESIIKVLAKQIPSDFMAMNEQALQIGQRMAEAYK